MKSIKLVILIFIASNLSLKAQILFSETFSTSLGQCSSTNSVSGTWMFSNSCGSSSLTGHSGPGHAIFSGSGCQFGNGSNTVSGNLNTPTIAIGPSGAVLTFNYLVINECGFSGTTCTYDVLKLQISNNGGTSYTDIMSSSGSPVGLVNGSVWAAKTYTLNAYSNQTIIIRFNFDSGDGVLNAYDGVYIDDIIVTGNCFINLTTSPLNSTVSPVICAGNSLTLTTNAVSNYSWSTGATTPSIVVSPTNPTMYSIIATSSANCSTSASLNVQVNNSVPSLSIANTASATGGSCPNSTVVLTGSGAISYTWSGGSVPVTNGIAFTPTSSGTYTLIGSNACGSSSIATSLSIHPIPTATAIASTPSLCSGNSLTLTGIGTASIYTWYGGAGGITNGVGFYPTSTAIYTVIGTAANSCTASATVPVTVATTPNALAIANPPLICIGGSSTLTATGAANYTWTSGTQTVNTPSFVVTPSIGITNYTVTKANSNCVDTKTISVITNALPNIFAIVTPTVVCALTPATLAVGGALTYTWTSPGPPSYTFTGASPIVSPVAPSTYSVAASDGTCINTTTVFLNANPNPTIVVSASTPTTCGGEVITLNATGGINYTWTSTGSATAASQSFTDAPTIPTAYNVIGDNSFGCTTSANQVVLVLASPTITATRNPTLVCSGNSATVTASGANTYTWSANAGGALTAVTVVNPTSPISGPVTFTVEGTNSQTGCKSTRTVVVNVFVPSLSVSGNTNTCAGDNVTLTILGGNSNYNWNTGSSNFATQNITASLTAPSVFTLSANTTSAGVSCPSTQTVELGIYFNPTITAVADRTTICRDESVDITAGGGISYYWNTGSTNTVLTVSPVGNIINYTVTGTDANGCTNTASVQIKISGCVGLTELNLINNKLNIYPNPNSGVFSIESNKALKLNLISELGQLIRVITLSETNQYKVSINDLAKGIYFISGQNGDSQIYQKIVVME